MTTDIFSSRRSFLKGGAFIAVPLIAVPSAALADDGGATRLAQLEDEAAVRAAHQRWMRDNSGALALLKGATALAPDHEAEPLAIEIACGGRSAIVRQPCIVESASALEPDCTFARMALAQGNSCMRQTERRMLSAELVKSDDGWIVANGAFAVA
jgi:hypothetical protein